MLRSAESSGYPHFGIQISGDSCLYEYNEVDVFDGDGLRGVANDLTFQHNLVKNSIVASGANHDDGFQSQPRPPPVEKIPEVAEEPALDYGFFDQTCI
jgi:hypothetical protein